MAGSACVIRRFSERASMADEDKEKHIEKKLPIFLFLLYNHFIGISKDNSQSIPIRQSDDLFDHNTAKSRLIFYK